MTSLHILLEARSAVHRCWRAYEIDVGADLFGAWLVQMSYGRIGTIYCNDEPAIQLIELVLNCQPSPPCTQGGEGRVRGRRRIFRMKR